MKNIFVIGAGRTATALISYLLKNAGGHQWKVTVGDFDYTLAEQKIGDNPHGRAIKFDALDDVQRETEISNADIVVSFLPPAMHVLIANECLKQKTNMVTASYVSDGMMKLDEDVKKNGLLFLNEMGLDPGIDHMDVMQLKEKVEADNGEIISLKSFCGALISPESDDNPWHYKFTWSPMNVVLAGQANARYKENFEIKEVPYEEVFTNTEKIIVSGLGSFEAYPNRDSIPYIERYGLSNVRDFYRGTLRRPGFCEAWDALRKMGLTNNKKLWEDTRNLTISEWVKSSLPLSNGRPLDDEIASYLNITKNEEIFKKISWLDLFSNRRINLSQATSAQILLNLLLDKWEFREGDRDMVVLQTEIIYHSSAGRKKLSSTMVYKGRDQLNTAMTYTGGLPVGVAVKLIAAGKIKEKGIVIPIYSDIYKPVLKELEEYGIRFNESETIE
jgi:saccharopine dehydrogenase-like NADP-dependent oxidoreductase